MALARGLPIRLQERCLFGEALDTCLQRIFDQAVVKTALDPGGVAEIRKVELVNGWEVAIPPGLGLTPDEVVAIPWAGCPFVC